MPLHLPHAVLSMLVLVDADPQSTRLGNSHTLRQEPCFSSGGRNQLILAALPSSPLRPNQVQRGGRGRHRRSMSPRSLTHRFWAAEGPYRYNYRFSLLPVYRSTGLLAKKFRVTTGLQVRGRVPRQKDTSGSGGRIGSPRRRAGSPRDATSGARCMLAGSTGHQAQGVRRLLLRT